MYLYKFETLVPFEVLSLRLDVAILAPLPMLETLYKICQRPPANRWQALTAFRRGLSFKLAQII